MTSTTARTYKWYWVAFSVLALIASAMGVLTDIAGVVFVMGGVTMSSIWQAAIWIKESE